MNILIFVFKLPAFEFKKAIMQGTVFAPINRDTLGRDCLANGDGLYEYKSTIYLPGLSMVDDLVGVTTWKITPLTV